MKIGFVAPCVPGHLYPTLTLARHMMARGHDIVLLGIADAEPFALAAGVPFAAFGRTIFAKGFMASKLEKLSRLRGEQALEFTIQSLADSMQGLFDHLPDTITRTGTEALVMDAVSVGAGLIPMHLGIPYVHVSNAMHFDFSGRTPFCVFDWEPGTDPDAQTRFMAGLQGFLKSFAPVIAKSHAYAEVNRMKVDWTNPFATMSPLAWLSQTPEEFDFPGAAWPPQFRYMGPFNDGVGRIEAGFPWERLTGEPLIYASMGTLQNGVESVFSIIAEAAALPGFQLVLSTGSNADSARIARLPDSAIVVPSAPQVELLRRSALCITHAGLNTVLECLAEGVPMIAIPVTNDQPGVAARIQYWQTGRSMKLQHLTSPGLRGLIDEVLANPEYRENARRLQRAIAKGSGLARSVALLEETFGVVRPESSTQQREPVGQGPAFA